MSFDFRFAVVLPTFNRPELLAEAVGSLIAQTYKNWRVYVVNDASSIDYSEVERRFARDERIQFINLSANGGINPCRNVGIDVAYQDGFDFLTFLDDDDRFAPDYFVSAAETIRDTPDYGWYMSNNCGEQKGSSKTIRVPCEMDFVDDYIYRKFRGDKAHLFSSDALSGIRMDERFRSSHRWPFFIKIGNRTKIWAFPHASVYKQYLDGGITKGNGNNKKKSQTFDQICHRFMKHGTVIRYRPFKLIAYRYFLLEFIKALPRFTKFLISIARQ